MIAAVYARKSTEQNVSDEEKSVTRQIERARAYAARKGWAVSDAHVHEDRPLRPGPRRRRGWWCARYPAC